MLQASDAGIVLSQMDGMFLLLFKGSSVVDVNRRRGIGVLLEESGGKAKNYSMVNGVALSMDCRVVRGSVRCPPVLKK